MSRLKQPSKVKSKPTTNAAKSAGSGRPKDLAKRASILEAAKTMFIEHGFDRVSMDQVAAEAGVSKLTVYSHFGDKNGLFAEAVRAHCEQEMPISLFDPNPDIPLRERLLAIGHAFFSMIMTPEAIASHRILCSPQVVSSGLPDVFWKAGPLPIKRAFAELLRRRIQAGELEIDDPDMAAGYFFTLIKGDPHAQAVFGFCCDESSSPKVHIENVVNLFLRAYAKR